MVSLLNDHSILIAQSNSLSLRTTERFWLNRRFLASCCGMVLLPAQALADEKMLTLRAAQSTPASANLANL